MTYQQFRERYAFWGLLVSMTMAFLLTPFIHNQLQPLNLCILSSFIFSVIVLGDSRLHLIGAGVVITPMCASIGLFVVNKEVMSLFLFFMTTALFFSVSIALFMQRIFSKNSVDTNTLLLAICIYYAMAIVWTMLYGILLIFIPESYNFAPNSSIQSNINDLMYFSLVTLTTLGYGDIQPLSPEAKSLAAMESVVGQVYLTVLVARLVGLHIANPPNTQ